MVAFNFFIHIQSNVDDDVNTKETKQKIESAWSPRPTCRGYSGPILYPVLYISLELKLLYIYIQALNLRISSSDSASLLFYVPH